MAKYRKKPAVIDAIQFQGFTDGPDYLPKYILDFVGESSGVLINRKGDLVIATLEGDMVVSKGDYIIRGILGELYPCKPNIFEKTYDGVNE